MSFQFLLTAKIIMERGLRQKTGEHLAALGLNKVLLVTDPGVKNAGLLPPVYASLQKSQITFVEIADVKANPRAAPINQTAARFRGQGFDGLLAVGGGSAMDAAKALAVLLTHEGRIEDYEGAFTLKRPALPVVAIPTTAGTGSEVTFFSVITDSQRQTKMSLLDYRIGPQLALLDSDITASLPPAVAAATAVDALTHAIEAYTGKLANPISDGLALHAIRLIAQNLKAAVLEADNFAAREQMLIASLMAGMAFGNADIASVHCISESIGGLYDTPHGVGNAIFLPFVFAHNQQADLKRHADVAYALGIDPALPAESAAQAAVDRLFALNRTLGIPRFAELPNVREADFLLIAEKSKNNISDSTNIKPMTVESYLSILRAAWQWQG
ncbi:1,3-propanediol dehydrogenase [Ventosimonas gracilis]|uniref:1,3-propanediol dehydrogenase n=1 Tax=Ventosimonas gracilis TaxID=1680762 RepID=A0A139SVX0_9GAMM|nr:iron-containing alcohol dehydrogenase [Ventosimonas gracilis]KXU38735.1 1,3-propanediol dehydrogenase [Ventosimonas gracilis]